MDVISPYMLQTSAEHANIVKRLRSNIVVPLRRLNTDDNVDLSVPRPLDRVGYFAIRIFNIRVVSLSFVTNALTKIFPANYNADTVVTQHEDALALDVTYCIPDNTPPPTTYQPAIDSSPRAPASLLKMGVFGLFVVVMFTVWLTLFYYYYLEPGAAFSPTFPHSSTTEPASVASLPLPASTTPFTGTPPPKVLPFELDRKST